MLIANKALSSRAGRYFRYGELWLEWDSRDERQELKAAICKSRWWWRLFRERGEPTRLRSWRTHHVGAIKMKTMLITKSCQDNYFLLAGSLCLVSLKVWPKLSTEILITTKVFYDFMANGSSLKSLWSFQGSFNIMIITLYHWPGLA